MSKIGAIVKKLYRDKRVRFLFVGCLNTIGGYVVGAIFTGIFLKQQLSTELSNALGAAIGTIVGGVHSYFWNKYFTFQTKKKSAAEALRFGLVYVVQYGVSTLLNIGFSHIIENHWIYQLITICITTVLSWLGHNYFSFRKPKSEEHKEEEGKEAKEERPKEAVVFGEREVDEVGEAEIQPNREK
jgi:putative flippase GtrA